jgi:hypothetical protein
MVTRYPSAPATRGGRRGEESNIPTPPTSKHRVITEGIFMSFMDGAFSFPTQRFPRAGTSATTTSKRGTYHYTERERDGPPSFFRPPQIHSQTKHQPRPQPHHPTLWCRHPDSYQHLYTHTHTNTHAHTHTVQVLQNLACWWWRRCGELCCACVRWRRWRH